MKFNPMTGQFEEEQKFGPADLLTTAAPEQAPAAEPKINTYDSLDTLEDIGYEAPTKEQTDSEGFRAASKYLKNSQPIVGAKAAELLGAYKNMQADRSPASEEPELSLEEESPETTVGAEKPNSSQDQLSLLQKYKELIGQRDARNFALDIGSAANRLGSAIAGKGTTGGEFLQGLKKQSDQPIADLLGQGKVVDTENELQMSDPQSDISKFARERAIAQATKMGVSPDTLKSLEKMSAKQLEKLGLYKADTNSLNRPIQQSDWVDDQGQPVVLDVASRQWVNLSTGQPYNGKLTRKITTDFTDADGLKYKVDNRGEIIGQIKSPNQKTPTVETTNPETKQQETKVDYGTPTSLKNASPALYKKFTDLQGDFSKDMKESRETATAVTNLAAKLKPGQSMKIDSGLLGGIQTQAAKMAGQKGVLTDQDLVKFAGAGGVGAAIDRFFSGNFDGEMSEQDVNFFKAFAKKMEGSLAEDITNRSKLYSGQILNESKDYLPGLSEQDVSKWLQVDQVAPAVQQKAAAGKVTIQDSTGKSHVIDADKLEAAKKRDPGLKVVGQ